MHSSFSANKVLVKRGSFAFNYDVIDAGTKKSIIKISEPKYDFNTEVIRAGAGIRRRSSYDFVATSVDGIPLMRILSHSPVLYRIFEIQDQNGVCVGKIRRNNYVSGGKFEVFDASGGLALSSVGNFMRSDYQFIRGWIKIARVEKFGSSIFNGFLKNVDNYLLTISDHINGDDPIRRLIYALVICINVP